MSSLTFTCSFDDGHPADLRTAELLARHGLAATFYVPIRNREGAPVIDAAALRQLASSFEVGSHTLDHAALPTLDDAGARRQVTEGKLRLEQMLGRRVDGFCYPTGKYHRRHALMVRQAGFRYARGTVNLCLDAGRRPFDMPATLQYYPHAPAAYLRNFLRGGHWLQRSAALAVVLRHASWPARLHALFHHACRHGGVFHLWGHSKDLEADGAWQDFDAFLAHVASCVAPMDRLTNGQLAARAFAAGKPVAAQPA